MSTELEAMPTSLMDVVSELIPKGRAPYVDARIALCDLSPGPESCESARFAIEQAAAADADRAFLPSLPRPLSLALQEFNSLDSEHWYDRKQSPQYPNASDEVSPNLDVFYAARKLLALIVDHGSSS